jgi:hypothetical protein
VRLVGHGAPPDAPEVFKGKERISEYLRKTYLGGWTPRVGYSLSDVFEGDGRIALNVAYVDANGTQCSRPRTTWCPEERSWIS